jgi:hypothetical protein
LARSEAALPGTPVVVQAEVQAQPTDHLLDFAVVEAVVQARRAEAVGCELAGDRGAVQALPGQGPDPLVSAG